MPGGRETAYLKYGPHLIFEQVASKLRQAIARASDWLFFANVHRTIHPVLKLQLPLALSVTISLKIKHEEKKLLRDVSTRFNQNL
jgi:hypothetical protein